MIEVEQKQLKYAYIFVNVYCLVLITAPIWIAGYAYAFVTAPSIMSLVNAVFISLIFVLFGKFWFIKHRQLSYLFEGHYHQKDKQSLKDWFSFNTLLINNVYSKLPLPFVDLAKLNRRNRNWRAR